ncbi:MAG: hypothetical protein ACPGO3_10445 [Magnetospiraceae bacterium]
MRLLIIGLLVGLVLGVVVGARYIGPDMIRSAQPIADVPQPDPEEIAEVVAEALPEALPTPETQTVPVKAKTVEIAVAGSLPRAYPVYTTVVAHLESLPPVISDGKLVLTYTEEAAFPVPQALLEAVAEGKLQAALGDPALWGPEVPALYLFGGIPFGPTASEILAWLNHGGGGEIHDRIYHAMGVHAVVCGVEAPRGGGWFRQRILSLDTLDGKTVAIEGPGAWVLESFGIDAVPLDLPGIFTAMESGQIVGAFHGSPAVDRTLQLHRVARNLHMPGWHRQSGLIELILNLETWEGLSATDRSRIESVCAASVRATISASEAGQYAALSKLEEEGARVQRWPAEVLTRLEQRWLEIAKSRANSNPDFGAVWNSLQDFRKQHQVWQNLGYVQKPALQAKPAPTDPVNPTPQNTLEKKPALPAN